QETNKMKHTIEVPQGTAATVTFSVVAGNPAHVVLTWEPFGPEQRIDYVGNATDDPIPDKPENPGDQLQVFEVFAVAKAAKIVVDVSENATNDSYDLLHEDHIGHHVRVVRFGTNGTDKFAVCLFRFGS